MRLKTRPNIIMEDEQTIDETIEEDIEESIAELELNRLLACERELRRVQELVDKQINEMNTQESENKKLLAEVALIEQLENLVEYSERYTSTLELIVDQQVQGDPSIVRNILESAQDREDRSNAAAELVYNLLGDFKLQKDLTGA